MRHHIIEGRCVAVAVLHDVVVGYALVPLPSVSFLGDRDTLMVEFQDVLEDTVSGIHDGVSWPNKEILFDEGEEVSRHSADDNSVVVHRDGRRRDILQHDDVGCLRVDEK